MNSPDSTTSLSGVVAGCGEIQRSGLAVQITLFRLTRRECDSVFLSQLATGSGLSVLAYYSNISSGKGFHLVPSISDTKSF